MVLVQTSGSFITSLVDYTGRVPEFLMVRAAAFGSMFLVLGIGKLIISSPLKRELKPFATVLTFALSSVTSVFVDDTLLQVMHFTSESRFFNRLGLSIVGLPIAMIVTALIVTSLHEYSAKNQKLSETANLLLSTRSEAEQRIANRKAELFERIQQEITMSIESLNSEDSKISQNEMKSLLDDVVRPLSFELDRGRSFEETNIENLPEPKIKWRSVFSSSVTNGNPFHPIAAAAWPTLTSTSFVAANFGPIGFLSGILFFAIYASCTWFARKLWNLFISRLQVAFRVALITLFFGLSGWAASFALMIPDNGALLAGAKIYFMIIFTELVAWTVALLFTANQLLNTTTEVLTTTNDDLKREVLSLNSALRKLHRGISRVLHGPVQQAITASIFRLQSSPDASSNKEVIQEVRQRIKDSLSQLNDESRNPRDLSESFEELKELWSGVATITINVNAQDMRIIQSNPQTTDTVWELVNEATVNAIKHSEPTKIDFTIQVQQNKKQITIHKTSDGKPLTETNRSGLGTQMLNELCLEWKRSQQGDLVALDMVIPIYEN